MLRTTHWLAILAMIACGCTQNPTTPSAAKTGPGPVAQATKPEQADLAADEHALAEARELLAKAETFPFEFTLPDLDDKPVSLADYKEKIVIVDIWATWCPPCRTEIPHFIELKKQYAEKGFDIVGINYERAKGDEVKQLIGDFVKETGVNYTCVIGDEATQGQVPNLQYSPTTLFIDRAGKVRLKVEGYHKLAVLDWIVNELLSEEAPPEEAGDAKASGEDTPSVGLLLDADPAGRDNSGCQPRMFLMISGGT